MPNIEAIAFNEDHARYQAQEAAADHRAEWIEDMVKQLLEGEYDPFTPDHVSEALCNLSSSDEKLLAEYVSAAFKLPDSIVASKLSDFITDRVQDYWHACAVMEAEKEYDRKEF